MPLPLSLCSRPDIRNVIDELKSFGATEVVTEEFAQSYRIKSLVEVNISMVVFCCTGLFIGVHDAGNGETETCSEWSWR